MKQVYNLIHNAEQNNAQSVMLYFDDDDKATDVCKTLRNVGYNAEVIEGWQVKVELRK